MFAVVSVIIWKHFLGWNISEIYYVMIFIQHESFITEYVKCLGDTVIHFDNLNSILRNYF